MQYVVYEVKTGRRVSDRRNQSSTKTYNSESAAEACRTRLVRKQDYQYCELAVCLLEKLPRFTRKVRNLMSGQEVEIDVNTPHCCDPSTETYWSM